MVIGNIAFYQSEPIHLPRGESDEEDGSSNSSNDGNQFHVIQTKAIVDPMSERLYCPFCKSLMRYLPGFPQGHAQWLCEGCAHMAYEAYKDTPSYDTEYRSLSSPNDPYPTDLNLSRPIIKDLPNDLDEEDRHGQWGRVDINTADKKRRYGQMFAYLTAQEASRQI